MDSKLEQITGIQCT